MVKRLFAAVLAFIALLVCTPAFAQGKRVALVIGNSEYKHTPRLENPKNDATDVAAALKKLGFSVMEGRDLDKAALDRAVRDFAEALGGAHTGLFFYAGHGLQVAGQNYLVPTDAKLTTASAVDFEMVRLDLIHRTMEREANTNILMIDACRDNPLARNLARALGTRSTQIGRGLTAVESGEGTLISFSTQPGNVALDGTGRNSPYAAALLKHIASPGDDLPSVLINVRNDVMQTTARRQVPWEHSAMTAKFYFVPPRPTAHHIEMQFWASVKDSTNPAVLGTYLQRYPEGEFAPVARALVTHYEQQLKLELAARERERRRQEDELKAAEARRLENEQKTREAALAIERKRAEDARNTQEAARLDKERAELAARSDDLRKALEEARAAREAAKAAEEQRLAALTASEKATKDAEAAIAKKRDSEGNPTKLAALPKIEKPASPGNLNGYWTVTWKSLSGPPCLSSGFFSIRIEGESVYHSTGKTGSVSAGGAVQWTTKSPVAGTNTFRGTLRGSAGSGRYETGVGNCGGPFTAKRN